LLKQIPSTSIKKIELITNPSAKYNPEGMSGIINIVLHKNSNNGFNASVNTGATFATTPKLNSSIDMNYREGKVNFFGTYGNNFGYQFSEGEVHRLDEDSDQLFNNKNDNKSHLFKIGMDFYIDDHNTISVYTNQNIFTGKSESHSSNLFPNASDDFFSDDRNFNDNKTGSYNLAYKHLFKKEGHTLDFETNYSKTSTDQEIIYNPSGDTPIVPYMDWKEQNRALTTVNVDYINPLSEKSTLELGAEGRLIRTDNNFDTTGIIIDQADYIYDQDIFSAYVTFGQKFKKFSYQLGARFESYKVEAILNGDTAYKDDYFTVYPSAYLTYSLNDKNSFQLSYSRRVDRPSLEQSSPLPEFSTQRLISIGNPELDPQFTNSMELNYTKTFEKGSLSTGVFYRIINDEINRILTPNPENTNNQIMTFDNFDNNTAFGFEVSTNYKIKSWWDIQPAIDFSSINQQGYVSIESITTPGTFDLVNKKITANAFNARMNNNFKATKRLSFLLFGFYRSGVDGIQFDRKEMYKIDAGTRYSLWQNKASLSLRVNDIFETMRFGFDGSNPYPQRGEFRWESQSVYVNFNYRFGAGKNRALQRKQREDNTKQNSGGMF
jgi:outer membrane receptor protein involved in Fe transport